MQFFAESGSIGRRGVYFKNPTNATLAPLDNFLLTS